MPTASSRALPRAAAGEVRAAIERFLKGSTRPALLEPGEDLLPLTAENHALELRNSHVVLHAWDRNRNLVRRLTGIRREERGRLELVVERFARREGRLFLLDLNRPAAQHLERRGPRLVFAERFRRFLLREFPDWNLSELTAEPDLEHSLSAVFPRALLRRGQSAWAAIAAPPEAAEPSDALAFGLIWLDYVRRREQSRMAVEGLLLYLRTGSERTTCLRLRYLDPAAASYQLFTYSEHEFAVRSDPADIGNLDTKLERCRRPVELPSVCQSAAAVPGVDQVSRPDGAISLRVRGLEFARAGVEGVHFGLQRRFKANKQDAGEMEQLAQQLAGFRSPAADANHPLFRQAPEAWLESQVRQNFECVDASLLAEPVYGQVPAFAGGNRGVLDLLAADHQGRLAVLELKASADLQLPLQALDYWMRVKWHLEQDEFPGQGYFPGRMLHPEAPRLLLLSPALEFHPTTEAILSFFSPSVDVVRIGLGVEWRKRLEIMFRLEGAQRP